MGSLTNRECAHCSTTNNATSPFCVSCGAPLPVTDSQTASIYGQQPTQPMPVYASGLNALPPTKMQAPPISLADFETEAHDDVQLASGSSGMQQQQKQYEKVSMQSPARRGLLSRRTLLVGLTGFAVAGGGLLVAVSQLSRTQPAPPVQQTKVVAIPTPLGVNNTLLPAENFSFAWSADGRYLGCSSANGTLMVKDVTSNTKLVNASTNAINEIVWSPLNSSLLACACDDTTVQIRQMPGDSIVQTYREHANPVETLSWTQDGKYIASADASPIVNVWEAASLRTISSYSNNILNGAVTSLAWSPDGKRLACGCTDNTVVLLDIAKNQLLQTYALHQKPVEAVAWSPDGRSIASAGDDSNVHVWSPETGEPIALYSGHTDKVWCLAWSPDSQYLASGSWDKTVRIWTSGQREPYQIFSEHQDRVVSLGWSKQGRIGSVDAGGNIILWEMVSRSSGQI
ncbi:MAG TPA: WD40 repeat domain-containing protein [Ktedonobacteraceae bacterium]|jgi:WD40 repeat protein|nr:WD40 repeat domain-containing protein [Ktedonobacteraceae bacterium]